MHQSLLFLCNFADLIYGGSDNSYLSPTPLRPSDLILSYLESDTNPYRRSAWATPYSIDCHDCLQKPS